MSFHVPERYRIGYGPLGSDSEAGNNGAFLVPSKPGKEPLKVIASDGAGWEHVSVSLSIRCPYWTEMAKIKRLFWDAQDCVVQFHPPESEYVNNHPFCLHMWRATDREFPMPMSVLVGYADLGTLKIEK